MTAEAETPARMPLVFSFEPRGAPDAAVKTIGSHQATRAELRAALLAPDAHKGAVVAKRQNTRPLENLYTKLTRSFGQTARQFSAPDGAAFSRELRFRHPSRIHVANSVELAKAV